MGNNIRIKNKRKGECFNCNRVNEKKRFIRKTIQGNFVYVCPGCGMNNSDCIFKERIQVPKRELILGMNI